MSVDVGKRWLASRNSILAVEQSKTGCDMSERDEQKIQPSFRTNFHDLRTAAEMAGVTVSVLEFYWEDGVARGLSVEGLDGLFFEDDSVYRVRRAERLRRQHGIDPRTAAAIMKVMEKVERLEAELAFWRG